MLFEEWWEKESGWGGELLSEGQLAKEAWICSREQLFQEIIDDITPIMEQLFEYGYDEEDSVGQKLNEVRIALITSKLSQRDA